MCEYISFIVAADGQMYVGSQRSHSGVAEAYGLTPGSYREAEWTSDRPSDLLVRCEDGDDPQHWVSLVLSKYPTRSELIAGLRDGQAVDEIGARYWFRDGKRHREDGPAVERADGSREWWRDGKHYDPAFAEAPKQATKEAAADAA